VQCPAVLGKELREVSVWDSDLVGIAVLSVPLNLPSDTSHGNFRSSHGGFLRLDCLWEAVSALCCNRVSPSGKIAA